MPQTDCKQAAPAKPFPPTAHHPLMNICLQVLRVQGLWKAAWRWHEQQPDTSKALDRPALCPKVRILPLGIPFVLTPLPTHPPKTSGLWGHSSVHHFWVPSLRAPEGEQPLLRVNCHRHKYRSLSVDMGVSEGVRASGLTSLLNKYM